MLKLSKTSSFVARQTAIGLALSVLLTACADDNSQVAAPSQKAKKASVADVQTDGATSLGAALSTPELDQLNATMTQLEAQKTTLTQKLSQIAIAASKISSSTIAADTANTDHSTVGDGISVAAGAAGVALSVMTGGIGGIVMGGFGVLSAGTKMVQDSQADAAHAATVKANNDSLAQAEQLRQGYQAQLDQVNTQITQVQAKIDAATAALTKSDDSSKATAAN